MKQTKPNIDLSRINSNNFLENALKIFRYQAVYNPVYKEFIQGIGCKINEVNQLEKIPFLPISFFKIHEIISGEKIKKKIFLSSGTTGMQRSKHILTDTSLYENSFRLGFDYFFGDIKKYTLLALLPSYLEQENSSLVYMVNDLIQATQNKNSGFYLNDYNSLIDKLEILEKQQNKTILIGVSYALLDLIEKKTFHLKNTLVMETGGMKGRRREMIKSELHQVLKKGFGIKKVYSEYGMTELLSQAYSTGDLLFKTPPWMRVLIREVEDPLSLLPNNKSGGINVIDLANINSCSFIATQDLGKKYDDESFEVIGRFDHSDIRGCNLMV
jgi:phenylacetate-coenzyme A ligase PaaK-like adenylate-forming protein